MVKEVIYGVEISYLDMNYVTLIQKGLIGYDRVQKRFRLNVAIVLIATGYEDKVTDETYLEEAKKIIAEYEAQEDAEYDVTTDEE